MYGDRYSELPEKMKEDLEILGEDYGIMGVTMTDQKYFVKLYEEEKFQSASLTYSIEGVFEDVIVLPNIGESFSDATEYEEEIQGLLEE